MVIKENVMINSLLWFGIGAGIGFCLFFKPKKSRAQQHLEMIEASKRRIKIWHGGTMPSPHFDHVHCTYEHELSMPTVQMAHIPPALPQETKWISTEEACRLAHLRFPNMPVIPKEDAQYD